mgnify:CR=1 FL=1
MYKHISVLLEESIKYLDIKKDGIYIDCTLGGGGHSFEILKRLDSGHLYAFDQDDYAIKKASEKGQGDYKEVIFEGYAPHGIAILVETATDNNTRTVANVRSYFNKCDGSLGTSGSVVFMFDHTCNFRINAEGLDAEEVEFEFIDFGAEEVFADDDGILIYAPFESFGAIQAELESRGIEILSSGFERIPQVTKVLTSDHVADVDKLLEKLEEDDDVQNVYHTMEESTE